VFVEAILDEKEATSADHTSPVYLEMIDRELACRLQAVEADDRADGALLREALPLHLALTPPQMLGQVEVLSPVEMIEFQKDFVKYDDVTQMADFNHIQGLHPTATRCTTSETCFSCGISIADFCEGPDDENFG